MHSTPTNTVAMTGEMTMRNAFAICEQLSDALAGDGDILVDCSETTETDVSFLQLLVAAHKKAVALGKSVTVRAPRDGAVHTALGRAGFLDGEGRAAVSEIGLPVEIQDEHGSETQ